MERVEAVEASEEEIEAAVVAASEAEVVTEVVAEASAAEEEVEIEEVVEVAEVVELLVAVVVALAPEPRSLLSPMNVSLEFSFSAAKMTSFSPRIPPLENQSTMKSVSQLSPRTKVNPRLSTVPGILSDPSSPLPLSVVLEKST